MEKAILFGPFVGELAWEMFRFAPYAIYLKKKSNVKTIIFTRQNRFDMYGQYADILVPLKMSNKDSDSSCFGLKGTSHYEIDFLATIFKQKYETNFEIIEHLYPNVKSYARKVKWQFPRRLMDYSFCPRAENKKKIIKYLDGNPLVLVDLSQFTREMKETILYQLINVKTTTECNMVVFDPKFPNSLRMRFPTINLITKT